MPAIDRSNEAHHHHRGAGGLLRAAGGCRIHHRRHRVHARADLLAQALPGPGGRSGRRGGDRRPGRGHRPQPARRPDGQPQCAQGLSCRPAGPRDLLPADPEGSAAAVRYPGRRHGVRPRRGGLLRISGHPAGQGQDRQVEPLHRLEPPAAQRAAGLLRTVRRHPSARGLREAEAAARQDRPILMDRRGDGRPERPRRSTAPTPSRRGGG